jgi:hypothetical protein
MSRVTPIFFFAGTTLLVGAAAAAEPPDAAPCLARPNAAVADLGLHVINVGYQRTLGCYGSAQVSAGLYGPWMVNSNVFGLAGGDHDPPGDVLGGAVRLRPFINPLGSAPTGLWISPFAQAGVVRGTRSSERLVGYAFAAGLSAGWTWRLGERFLLALGVGGQYHRVAFAGDVSFPGFSRFAPTVDINVDYSF